MDLVRNWKDLVACRPRPSPAHDHPKPSQISVFSMDWSPDHGFGKEMEGIGARTMDLVRNWKDLVACRPRPSPARCR